ncbi:MAG: DNA alkylation repair protein [archaeon]
MTSLSRLKREIHSSLEKRSCKKHAEGMRRYFKEDIRPLGVRTPIVRKLAADFSDARKLPKEESFSLAELLLEKSFEEGIFGLYLLSRTKRQWDCSDFPSLKRIAGKLSNWAHCDEFSCHTINPFVERFPDSGKGLVGWAGSENRWLRRASAVSLVPSVRKGKLTSLAFLVSGKLLPDGEEIVQKGVGWLLKELAKAKKGEVVGFLKKRSASRMIYRIAFENFPEGERRALLNGIFPKGCRP